MQIQTNVSLAKYTTMKIGGNTKYVTTITTKDELIEAVNWAEQRKIALLVLGGGSNVIFRDGFSGLVILNHIPGFEILQDTPKSTIIKIGAGENWDEIVARTVDMGLSGIEKLSAIPGSAGATPVQNVGAYGAEIADTFIELEAFDITTKSFVKLDKADCQFSYRNSIFKAPDNRQYIITSLILQLHKIPPSPPFYAALQNYLDKHNITNYTPQTIRDAVVAIRATKLPDPSKIPNTGSFFKNPIVPLEELERLQELYPEIPFYDMPGSKIKLLAGWLIDQAGLKGYTNHGMKVYEHNALVFVNESAHSYAELAAFKEEVVQKVHATFGITLEQEPELL